MLEIVDTISCKRKERATIFDGVELPNLLTIDKAAQVLGTDLLTLERWIEDGRVETANVNGQIRVLTSSIEDRVGQRTTSLSNQEQD